MSATLLRLLAQRRPASLLTQEAPHQEELEKILRAVAGARYDDRPTGWRVVVTDRRSAADLAAAVAGMASVPNMSGPIPRLKGKKLRGLAAFRGSLQWASTGGVGLAIIFRHDPDSGVPKRQQRAAVHAQRGLLEAGFYACGWGTLWSQREPHDPECVQQFYNLSEHEDVLGWLFVGRPSPHSVPRHTVNLPARELDITYI